MAALFKDIFSEKFIDLFSQAMEVVLSNFDKNKFITQVFNDNWQDFEYKQRMQHIAVVLKDFLATDYTQSVEQILALIAYFEAKGIKEQSIEFMFLPDFIEKNGLDDFETSIAAFEKITPFSSCEFAVRPFIIKYEVAMISRMLEWAKHPNLHVRRLASEGCRPRLPWAMALPALKKDPSAILPILEILKTDSSEYVRRSVANNLNDIAKDNPAVVLEKAKKWKGQSKELDWVVKHASRTLLKQGNQEILQLFGFGSIERISVQNFKLQKKVSLGNYLEFSFDILNEAEKAAKIRLEYAVYYKKKNGTLSKKVFKISEKQYAAKSISSIIRKQHFKPITTRVYYAGEHRLALIINGVEQAQFDFELSI